MELRISELSEERLMKDIESSLMFAVKLYRYFLSNGDSSEEAMKKAVKNVVNMMVTSTPILFLARDRVVKLFYEMKNACDCFLEDLQKIKPGRHMVSGNKIEEESSAKRRHSKYLVPIYTVESDYPPKAQRGIIDLAPFFGDEVNIGFRYTYIFGEPFTFENPHSHDYDQFLIFLGSPENIRDFDAEVDIALGEEGERYPITSNTLVYVPKGLVHTPFYFKRISKPIMFINMFFGSTYLRKSYRPR